MSGLVSRSRHFAYAWMHEPKPGELEYLGGDYPATYRHLHIKTVTHDTAAKAIWPHDGAQFNRQRYRK